MLKAKSLASDYWLHAGGWKQIVLSPEPTMRKKDSRGPGKHVQRAARPLPNYGVCGKRQRSPKQEQG